MPDDVTPAALRRLLDLQEQDTAITVLETRRSTLPEAQQLAELNDSLAELEADLAIATKQADEIRREQSRLEDEIKLTEDKINKEEQRMFSGTVANPKELSALQAEVESLKRRRGGHEDSLLEVMVGGESATETVQRLTAERDVTRARANELSAAVERLTGDIDAELSEHRTQRDSIAPEIPGSVLELYEGLREQKHGIGAAALVAGTCEGCHTKLPNKEVERLKAAGGLQRCDNCRRILVVG
ncbi:MAG: C4-type zinc ribbon domain-containing protein [Actinomycetota bacterium]|nr:C4-type zinc ribbon domain-containing protein [Actinomycetota bacterium]